jgi:alkylhydroperoxidase family enzyme
MRVFSIRGGRVQRVPMAEFEPGLKKRLDELWGRPINLYRALGNQPGLAAAWTEFANAVRHQSRTPRALREIMILRTAQIAHSEYEWAQHLDMARKAGVREAQIAALADWRASKEFDPRERAALALTEGVMAGRVSDALHAEAARHFSHAEYVELSMTAAFYAMVSRMIDALGVELDADIRAHSPRLS